ncbi:NrfD/PsrC family molybdoenzyme membrane anchor subunit [Vibrio sp.]|uniref:NrfD/PsrC family molybdoenzyme membrane anchor subunit n=1 Tax=Vibrio sp. TaxID=678 RepID=UPI003D1507A2
MDITEILIQPQQVAWLPWAPQYFFYIGAAYASSILFAAYQYADKSSGYTLRSALALVMAISAMVGPIALTGDLHQPGRAWLFYQHITPWSWMSRGALMLPLFSALSLLTAWLHFRAELQQLAHSSSPLLKAISRLSLGQWQTSGSMLQKAALLTALFGIGIAIYTGAEVAVMQSRALWHQAALPLLWTSSSFSVAVGLAVLLLRLLPASAHSVAGGQGLLGVLKISTVINLLLLAWWLLSPSAQQILAQPDWITGLSTFVTGSLVILVACFTLSAQKILSWQGLLLAGFMPLACGWYLRWLTMIKVQTVAKFDAASFPYSLPMGSDGLLSIVGMAGLWLAIALLASQFLCQTEPSHQPTQEA